jgi:hypothetical protein
MCLPHYVGYPGAMIVTVHCRSVNTAVAVRRLHREGRIQKRKCKKMHAEHADGDMLNDLPGRVVACAFTMLKHWDPLPGRPASSICVLCVHPPSSALRPFLSCGAARYTKRAKAALTTMVGAIGQSPVQGY